MAAISAAKSRAKKVGLPFDLTLEWGLEQLARQEGRCAVTGVEFDLSVDPHDRKTFFRPYAMSLDRKEPALGYVRGNVEIVCMAINLAFNQFGRAAFDELVERYLGWKSRREASPPAVPVAS